MLERKAATPITITDEMVSELAESVNSYTGEYPIIQGFRGRATPPGTMSFGYIGHYPGIVGFELCLLIARGAACASQAAGYTYVAMDFMDELRRVVLTIRAPRTEAMGRDLVYYWPTVELVGWSRST